MEMPLTGAAVNATVMKLVSTKQAIIASVLSTTVRTNDDMLRRRNDDRMADLLKIVEEERARR